MSKSPQQRALANFRSRLNEKGLVRFKVTGRNEDRQLVRKIARVLAEGGAVADRLRDVVKQSVSEHPARKGNILRALLVSPLSGSELDLTRLHVPGRKVEI